MHNLHYVLIKILRKTNHYYREFGIENQLSVYIKNHQKLYVATMMRLKI
jgi:hypothetical protein